LLKVRINPGVVFKVILMLSLAINVLFAIRLILTQNMSLKTTFTAIKQELQQTHQYQFVA